MVTITLMIRSIEMFGKKEKEPEVYNPFKHMARFCKFDGKELLEGKREILKEWFKESTGEKLVIARYMKFCPDWQTNRQVHTEQYKSVEEYADGTPYRDYWWI